MSGRCSVFCKSDCTHALNKGAPKESVVAGLCEMMAAKILELLNKAEYHRVLVVGGTSDNTVMLDFLNRKIEDISVPEHAKCFEALGAALWALDNDTQPVKDFEELFDMRPFSFSLLPPLKDYLPKVTFKQSLRQPAQAGDVCILGLDVGSTTTKAVIMRKSDDAILGSCYLRTNGDPIGASRECYRQLYQQLGDKVEIVGLGVTGSGRQIAGLHALTPGVINEIIAHAAAAVYFDPEVDTIFEIGGQDAKYTYITNKVPSDYAMNEACSAGTGSFLEESAYESLGIDVAEIGDIAYQGTGAPNFSDQCAAFIGSDIKTAIQEGISVPDIAAGLVYSICMNYVNRVKGSRAVGTKVFMQGGVCYNKAVPAAMAALTGKDIVVPPDPGLMGSFGVALELKERMALGLIKSMQFSLKQLADRDVTYKDPFQCAGGKEKCDRKCKVNRIVIEGKIYPFGGACNKYYNLLQDKKEVDTSQLDLVQLREQMAFKKYAGDYAESLVPPNGKTVGINNSLLTATLYPLYYNFFAALGYNVITAREIDHEGIERKGSAFCYPVEIGHGSLSTLIKQKPDIYFLPHIKAMPTEDNLPASATCPFVQGEPYYLQTAFEEIGQKTVLAPVFDFTYGYESAREEFMKIGKQLGFNQRLVTRAYKKAAAAQNAFHLECQRVGQEFLKDLEQRPDDIAVVLFGRPYNAFTRHANMGIPQKFASRGYTVVPCDFLPYGSEEPAPNMYWALGRTILKAANFVERHPQLFGTYITNFSCGPDSFLVSYFRNIMGRKPSLTLELDSHTADAGVDTRIEAFLDVVKNYLEMIKHTVKPEPVSYRPAEIVKVNDKIMVRDSQGRLRALQDPEVHVVLPSMGELAPKLLAATFGYVGVRATALPPPRDREYKLGQGFASCKECLPLILTLGSLIEYLDKRENKDEILIYFMPETSGPCRFGQYNILMKNYLEKMGIENVALLSLTSDNSYAGFGTKVALRAWQAVIINDVLDDILSAILVLAKDQEHALRVYKEVCDDIFKAIAHESWDGVKKTMRRAARKLRGIEKTKEIEEAPKIALIGEIYVRRDDFSRQDLVQRLATRGFIVKAAPIAEWMIYCDYNLVKGYSLPKTMGEKLKTYITGFFKNRYEHDVKSILAKSGLYEFHMIDIDHMVENVKHLVNPRLTGETILTVASALTEVVEEVSGVISIGPFGCMPGRMAEAIISETINEEKIRIAVDKDLVRRVMEDHPSLPFLAIETDGNLFTQVVEARLEAFCLQVERLHRKIQDYKQAQA
ncbi:MAG: acyl-CoA dehydratase activase [Candidatus Saccharibacteria bacterium]